MLVPLLALHVKRAMNVLLLIIATEHSAILQMESIVEYSQLTVYLLLVSCRIQQQLAARYLRLPHGLIGVITHHSVLTHVFSAPQVKYALVIT